MTQVYGGLTSADRAASVLLELVLKVIGILRRVNMYAADLSVYPATW
jgi:hypothetical protein